MVNKEFERLTDGGKHTLRFSPSEAQIVMYNAYDNYYGVRYGEDVDRQMPIVGYNWTEQINHYSVRAQRIKDIIKANACEHTKMSMKELLELPRYKLNAILTVCDEISEIKLNELNNSPLGKYLKEQGK